MKLYQVVGRKAPTKTDENPPAYRMKLFARNEVMAKSRFWYFMHQMRKMKKTTGEILDVNEIVEKNTRYVKNYGIWVKYNSRSGTHNMYREYRDISINRAVETLYNDMAGRHRSRNKSIQIIKTATVAAKDCKRVSTLQMHNNKLRFPLPHRIMRPTSKQVRSLYNASRPSTHFQ
uniref:60S ribosomal protein L18a n=1 Tax=Phaeocystis cordata TaxID=118079 RepID=A0A7S1HRC7_9EUKA